MLQGPEYSVSKQKRALDLLVASSMLVPSGIGLLAVRFALRGTGETALFRQKRIGQAEIPFEIIKLHTLDEATGQPLFPWAEALRDSRIDETPQAWNILRGHMSARAHRPIPISEQEEIMDLMPVNMQREYQTMIDYERPGWFSSHSIQRYVNHVQDKDNSLARAQSAIEDFYTGSLSYDIELIMQFAGGVILGNEKIKRY